MRKTVYTLVLTVLLVLSMASIASTLEPVPMAVYGYVLLHRVDGENVTAPADLQVCAKNATDVIDNDTTSLEGTYDLTISGPPNGASIEIWVEEIHVANITLQYMTTLQLNLTINDTILPSPPTDATWTSPPTDRYPNFTWTASTDNLAIEGYYVNITGYSTYTIGNITNWESPDELLDGEYTFYIWAIDLAGNNSTAASTNLTISVIGRPIVEILSPSAASPIFTRSGSSINITYVYTETNPSNATIKVHNNTHIIGQATVTDLISGTNVERNNLLNLETWASETTYNISITMYNADNLNGTDEETNAVIIDDTLPVVTITHPGEGEIITVAAVWINGTVIEINKGTLIPSINYLGFTLVQWNSVTGEFAFTNNTAIPHGALSLIVRFSDLAGNEGEDTVACTVLPPHLAFEIVFIEVFSCNQSGNPKEIFQIGTTAHFKLIVNKTSSEPSEVLITVNAYDSYGAAIGVAYFQGTLPQGESEYILDLLVPTSARIGSARVYACIFTDWPHLGGIPNCPESSATFEIVGG